ncbi:hypothetical protein BaRGS_00014982 [Batillaria attramentaria]|uniref:Uncharacterized protein n=1 Tax=Batillaria attramentaria TaxID=370345 RepID=A0ABD0L2U2_9CAEN
MLMMANPPNNVVAAGAEKQPAHTRTTSNTKSLRVECNLLAALHFGDWSRSYSPAPHPSSPHRCAFDSCQSGIRLRFRLQTVDISASGSARHGCRNMAGAKTSGSRAQEASLHGVHVDNISTVNAASSTDDMIWRARC